MRKIEIPRSFVYVMTLSFIFSVLTVKPVVKVVVTLLWFGETGLVIDNNVAV